VGGGGGSTDNSIQQPILLFLCLSPYPVPCLSFRCVSVGGSIKNSHMLHRTTCVYKYKCAVDRSRISILSPVVFLKSIVLLSTSEDVLPNTLLPPFNIIDGIFQPLQCDDTTVQLTKVHADMSGAEYGSK
jgi:hypothetical protein